MSQRTEPQEKISPAPRRIARRHQKPDVYLKNALAALETILPTVRRDELKGLDHSGSWNSDQGGNPELVAQSLHPDAHPWRFMIISSQLAANCQKTSERTIWLESLPVLLEELTDRWSLRVGPPFDHSGTCSWVAPVIRRDHAPAVLKLAMPHMEGEHEIEGLRFWNGNPTVKLIEADDQSGAMLLERCQPGTSLRSEPEASQDEVIARMLKRIRSANSQSRGLQQFRHLSEMLEVWQRGTLAQKQNWPDAGLVHQGLSIFERLSRPFPTNTLLATDLHAGNVLRAEREPWLMIDPKPFVGDAAFDVVQHLINCEVRLRADPIALVNRVAGLAEVDPERARLWTFARAAADPREDWNNVLWIEIARKLAP